VKIIAAFLPKNTNMKPIYCIIGAGPCGLLMARALKQADISFEILEKHSDTGGLWDIQNEGTPVYEAAHFISSRTKSGFPDFPMPDTFPDYPSRQQILTYIRAFAQHAGLYPHIQFNKKVISAQKITDTNWEITASDGTAKQYNGVICCNGSLWQENMPTFQGNFEGVIRHAKYFKQSSELTGKRVLVVGAGNSGVDIACEAANFADRAVLSMRRAYHFIPKYIFGKPADVFADEGPKLPRKIEQWVFGKLINMVVGDQTKLGLPKPDHQLLESHPILNSQIFDHLAHGNLAIKPDIAHLDGKNVFFKDGSKEEIDEIICATGYNFDIPFARAYFEWKNERPQLYLSMFNRKHDNLYAIGFMETNSAAYALLTESVKLLANYLKAKENQPEKAIEFQKIIETDTPDMSGNIHFVQSARVTGYVDSDTHRVYIKKMQQRMGWAAYKKGEFVAV
jgi:Flavin-binding monooxygenase-like